MGLGLQFAVNRCGMVTIGSDIANNRVKSKNKLQKEKAVFDFKQNQMPVDQMLEECSREFIRTTMIKHESIFNEQVSELHRLYKVQKKMMALVSKEVVGLHCQTSGATGAVSDTGFRINGSTSLTSNYSFPYINRSFNFRNRQNPNYKFHQIYEKSAGLSLQELGFYSGENLFNLNRESNLPNLSGDRNSRSSTSITSSQEYTQLPGRNLESEIGLEGADLYADKDNIDLDLSLSTGGRRNYQKRLRQGSHSDEKKTETVELASKEIARRNLQS